MITGGITCLWLTWMHFTVPGVFPVSAARVKAITFCPGDCFKLYYEALCNSSHSQKAGTFWQKKLKAADFGVPLP